MLISNCAEILLNKQYVISSSTPNYACPCPGLHRPAADAQRSAPSERGPVHGAPLAHGAGHRHRGGGHSNLLYIFIHIHNFINIFISMKAAFIYNVVITHQVISRVKLRQFQARRKWQRCQHIESHINT